MATKMKGLYKGFKFISNIFVVKEREMEIGHPTDVKHVAHIGWDGQSDSAPTWMSTYKTATTFSAASVNDLGASRTSKAVAVPSWSSRDFEQSSDCQQTSDQTIKKNTSLTDRPKPANKQKRKKIKSAASSPKSYSTSKASRAALSKSSLTKSMSQLEPAQNLQHRSAQSVETL